MGPGSSHPGTHCLRCGACCRTSSPSLHGEDASLLKEGILAWHHLMTIRRGEAVYDNIREKIVPSEEEMVKVREKAGSEKGCLFYEDSTRSCRIYDRRPVQCAALKCWDTRDFMKVFQTLKLTRRDILQDENLLELIRVHESRCSYSRLEGLLKAIPERGKEAVSEILRMLRFDHELRLLTVARLPVRAEEMDFLFGRPLRDTIGAYGLQVTEEGDGGFLLTPCSRGG